MGFKLLPDPICQDMGPAIHFPGDQLFQTNSVKRKEHFPSLSMESVGNLRVVFSLILQLSFYVELWSSLEHCQIVSKAVLRDLSWPFLYFYDHPDGQALL